MSQEICNSIKEAIAAEIEPAKIEVEGGGGHYRIEVMSTAFDGKSRVAKQRMVLSAIAHLMKGDGAPVHAVDSVKTIVG
ncbi:MAG: BolA family transcriptional regulator [Nannocystaceae bacterium]|nr:BolA family transcriptional regulator [Nannocystaceae bacterium]